MMGECVVTPGAGMCRLTVAPQDEVLVVIYLLLDVLAAEPEDLPAAGEVAVALHGKLMAIQSLRYEPHPTFTADLQWTVTLH